MVRRKSRRKRPTRQLDSLNGSAAAGSTDLGKLARPRRVSVVGATGSGKSVLAQRLSAAWQLPLYELDSIFWDERGRQLPAEEFVQAVSAVTAREEWVLDGHYRLVRELIWRRSEIVIWLNYPAWVVGYRLVRRFVEKRRTASSRQARDAHPDEEPHERAIQVGPTWRDRLGRLARTIRERREYGQLLQAPEYHAIEVVELRSVRAAEDLIRSRDCSEPGSKAGMAA